MKRISLNMTEEMKLQINRSIAQETLRTGIMMSFNDFIRACIDTRIASKPPQTPSTFKTPEVPQAPKVTRATQPMREHAKELIKNGASPENASAQSGVSLVTARKYQKGIKIIPLF